MNCCQCQGIEDLFNEKTVTKELAQYRKKGPGQTTRMLIEDFKAQGVRGYSLLDIGGGVGGIQHGLLEAGVQSATGVDASQAYLQAARQEAQRRGISERIQFQHGDFVNLAAQVSPADIVALDRVICCYHDMQRLVNLSAARAKKLYGVVYPRDAWWVRLGTAILNFIFRLQKSQFRSFIHPSLDVESLVRNNGLRRRSYRQTLIWQVVVYGRE